MLIEIERDALHFKAISRTGETIDAGTLYQDARHAQPEAPKRQDTAALR